MTLLLFLLKKEGIIDDHDSSVADRASNRS